MISRREAVRLLRVAARPPLTKRLTEGVLLAGFAGPAHELGCVSLYDEERVALLAATPVLEPQDLPARCRTGMLVVRMAAKPGIALLPPEDRRPLAVGPHWLCAAHRLRLRELVRRHGSVPVVGSVASYVVCTADLLDLEVSGTSRDARTKLVLGPPGPWVLAFDGRRLLSPPGNAWLLLRMGVNQLASNAPGVVPSVPQAFEPSSAASLRKNSPQPRPWTQ